MAELSSYWTKRRKIRKRVLEHLEFCAEVEGKCNRRNDENDDAKVNRIDNESVMQSDENDDAKVNRIDNESVMQSDESVMQSDESILHFSEQSDSEGAGQTHDIIYQEFQEPFSPLLQVDLLGSFTDSDKTSSDDDDSVRDHDLSSELASWAATCQVPQNAVNNLLDTLNKYHPKLPKDSRTLLNTPRHNVIKEIAGGSYCYFGIKNSLVNIIFSHASRLKDADQVFLQCNIDGLPLFKSSNTQFWPIFYLSIYLGRFPQFGGLPTTQKKQKQ